MDQQKKKGSFFGTPYSSSDPTMNVPVTAGSAGTVMSPYLNFDPAYIQPGGGSEFIFPEGSNKHRGRFELAFSQIGGSVLVGGALGGINGTYTGYRETATAQLTGSVRKTQMLNFITKQGASSAQTLGVVALLYSLLGLAVEKLRGVEDELNTVIAGTTTGLLYKSPAGWQRSLRGGAIGLGLATAYCLVASRDRMKTMLSKD